MPAKSGVSGAIMAVLPGQLGVGVFSPRLDAKGNSVRGTRVCAELSTDFGLHLFNTPRVITPAVRGSFSAAEVLSKRQRLNTEREVLRERGHCIRIFDLRGRLVFSSMELALREILASTTGVTHFIIDLNHVVDLDNAACRMLLELRDYLAKAGKKVFLTGISDKTTLRDYVASHFGEGAWDEVCRLRSRDEAQELCENLLLNKAGMRVPPSEELPLARQELCKGLTTAELGALESRLQVQEAAEGTVLFASGSAGDSMCFIALGEVGVFLQAGDDPERLVLRLGPGMSVGELALIDRQPRSATVRALSAVRIWVLPFGVYDRLPAEGQGVLQSKLLANLAGVLASRLRSSVAEVNSLK